MSLLRALNPALAAQQEKLAADQEALTYDRAAGQRNANAMQDVLASLNAPAQKPVTYDVQPTSNTKAAGSGDILNALTQSPEAKAIQASQKPDLTPLEKQRAMAIKMISSPNKYVQEQGHKMLTAYQASVTRDNRTTDIKNYEYGQSQEGAEPLNFDKWEERQKTKMFEDSTVSVSDSKTIRFKPEFGAGKVDPGTPWSELLGKVEAFDSQEKKDAAGQQKATSILGEIDSMLFSDKGIYSDFGTGNGGVKGKLQDLWKANSEYFLQNDTRFKNYTDYVQGTIAPLVKSLGTVGNLSETDILFAQSLIPSLFGHKIDSADVSKEKLRKLKNLIGLRDADKLNSESFNEVMSSGDLPPGAVSRYSE
jgi:hypothetical protein